LFLTLLTFISCSEDDENLPPDIPLNQLINAPDTINVEGSLIYLSTDIWRDFMPISPPDGKPMIALIYITAKDTAKIPASINTDAVWMVYNNEVWKSWYSNELVAPGELKQNRIVKIVRNGPKWGPHVFIDVIVRVYDSWGNAELLRASKQWISRTD
jgi:hypothetical protein